MKTTIKLLAVIALMLATFSQHSTASAASVFKFRGESVSAFFSSIDGCVETNVFVSATEGNFQSSPGRPSPVSDLFLFISQYDFCTDTLLLSADAFAVLSDEEFEVARKLASATLITTVTAFEHVSETPFDVSVDLTWTAVGPLSRQNNKSHFSTPGCKILSRFKGSSRFAEASGSVSDGTTNFTPEPSVDAFITSAKSGDVVIGCN